MLGDLDCGEEAPDIHDECSDEQLETCNAYYDQLSELQLACDLQDPEEPGFAKLSSCCRHLDDEDFMEHYECIMALETDECEAMMDCYPDERAVGGETSDIGTDSTSNSKASEDIIERGADAEDDGEDDEKNDDNEKDDEEDDSGCSVTAGLGSGHKGSMASLVFILGIAFATSAVRRRRSYNS
ncbi:MAG: hypothetical protein JXA30_18210 [Deltaproteobacteria bacterium]|nr:hypothetical protein [Deltaproteobacteria bacterium]